MEKVTAKAPIAGRSFTKFRLPSFTRDLVLFFFIIVWCLSAESAANITSFFCFLAASERVCALCLLWLVLKHRGNPD